MKEDNNFSSADNALNYTPNINKNKKPPLTNKSTSNVSKVPSRA